MYMQNRNRLTDPENKLVFTRGKGHLRSMGLSDTNYDI